MLRDQIKEKEFYSLPYNLSYSGLKMFNYDPVSWYTHYILNQGKKRDKTSVSKVGGALLHCLLLDEEHFKDQFVIVNDASISGKPKLILDQLYENHFAKHLYLSAYQDEILELMTEHDYFSKMKDPELRFQKINTPKNSEYFELLAAETTKHIISEKEYLDAKNFITENYAELEELLKLNEEGFNETHLSMPLFEADSDKAGINLHGVLDRHIVYKDKILCYDFKTSDSTLNDFIYNKIKKNSLHLQAAIYTRLLSHHYKIPIENIEYSWIVKNKNNVLDEVRVSWETMQNYLQNLDDSIEIFKRSYDSCSFKRHLLSNNTYYTI
jgi:hypothetical protein